MIKRIFVAALLVGAGTLSMATSPSDAAPPTGTGGAVGDLPSNASAKISSTPPEEPASSCPAGMVEIDGDYCPVVEQFCVRQVDPNHPERDRCAEFAPTGRCLAPTVHKRFCIDRYEFPNQAGVKPALGMDWNDAKNQCASVHKRLCADTEWTLACEGQERLPYPYGYVRNPEACNIDKPYRMPDDKKWANPQSRAEEITRLDQRDPSGARESCVSPYGVYDMTGNVDEWVVNEKGKEREKPYVSGLKGGYWGPVRDRCRPMTTDHNQWHTGYQIGFRCCEDVPAAPPSPEAARGGTPTTAGSPAGT